MSRHFDDLDAVLVFDACSDLWQLVFSLQLPPRFRGGVDEFEHHQLGRFSPTEIPLSVRSDNSLWRTRSRSGLTCADGPSALLRKFDAGLGLLAPAVLRAAA